MKKALLLICLGCALTLHAQHRIADSQMHPYPMGRRPAHATQVATTMPPRRAEGLSSLQRPIGYIADNDPDSITIKGALVGNAGTYPLAVLVGSDMLGDYVGCRVIGIRVAAAQSLGKSNVWLIPLNADGTSSAEAITKSQRLYEGWNNVFFNGDTSWEIHEGDQLLVGFDYQETASMIAAEKGGICTVGEAQGDDFLIYTDLGSGEGWYSVDNLGSLCVQLIVDISNLPEKMLCLSYLDTGFRYKQKGEQIEMYTIATNTGRSPLTGYTVRCRIDNEPPVDFNYQLTLVETAGDHQQPTLPLPANIAIGEHQLSVTLLAEGEESPTSEKASKTVAFYVYGESLQRHQVYVEQYNSQDEYYASLLNPIFNQTAEKTKDMVLVNIYPKGSPLAIEASDYLHGLYAYTVPSFTINRSYFPGEEYIAYDVNFYAEQYPAFVPSIIGDLIAQDMLQPAFATIRLQPHYEPATRRLTVDVDGQLAEGAANILHDLSLTLLLTENNVHDEQVVLNANTGRLTLQRDYVHQHVLRQYVTPALGTPVSISGQAYTARHEVTVGDHFDIDQMTLVGFLTRGASAVTDANVKEMDITNCNSLPLAGITGIQTMASATDTPAVYYTLDGQQIVTGTPKRGIYLLKKGGKCRKIVIK